MAYTSGTTTLSGTGNHHIELAHILRAFAVANGWTVKRNSLAAVGAYSAGPDRGGGFDDELILYNTGLGGTDAIYIGFKTVTDSGNAYYYWQSNGATAFDAGYALNAQPGAKTAAGRPITPLANLAIDYKIRCNAQMISLGARIGTVDEGGYWGLGNTYYTKNQYPLALVIGGSHTDENIAGYPPRYTESVLNAPHAVYAVGRPAFGGNVTALIYRKIDGSWASPMAFDGGQTTPAANPANAIFPYANGGITKTKENLDGSYALVPIQIADAGNILFELDGIYALSGHNLVSGSTITVSAVNYAVFQNTFSSAIDQFYAMKAA